ncbi:hypothetical protein CCC_00609 [Paramagnetospirillum magnetotacticum MS-1]|uniref:Uncharacterized protein n=1 Tax=Paramagnetospirillum magnetotacticum MS-1 TaxID=272627 RepID=A0A0C2YQY7_PARME|nr:hypothetical protein [Paramagnetospirillum magnetotacticum]KIL97548.1 hypothetical protein CCC_00609 [Paramagnetospirillum magnetotacticum MS-1]
MFGFLKSLFAEEKSKPKAKPKSAAAPKPMTKPAPGSERAELLKRAQEVHRAKRKILDHLSDEDRAKLVSMAILTFLNQGREPDDKKR